ncbi:hypothetical protein [Rhodopseudomonas palustris]|uniref:hypothetical protein n=1 Tax=Rhodopseudomonas palustris TaxID=1076 RepID=UPI001F3D3E6E|nr:hypothetical protein [Rhodopseudomonas palustris]
MSGAAAVSPVVAGQDQTASDAAAEESAADAPAGDAPSADEAAPPAPSQEADGASERVSEIAAAIDLLDEKRDFFKSGARAGKPKQKAIEEIVGFDINDDEIDAALALRETGI